MFMLCARPSVFAADGGPDDPPPQRPGAARALVERQLAALSALADIGLEIARAAGRCAVAALEGGEPPPVRFDPALAYARAAKAVRMAIALQARLMKDLPAIERGEARALSELREARKQRIARLVDQAVEAHSDDDIEIVRLTEEAWARLSDADEYSALMTCPIAEAVARLCQDLGLDPEDWVGEGSPFAASSDPDCGAGLDRGRPPTGAPPAPVSDGRPPSLSPEPSG